MAQDKQFELVAPLQVKQVAQQGVQSLLGEIAPN